MKIIEEYLKKDLRRPELKSWEEIRAAYAERAFELVKHDWQSPSYLASQGSQAGRRTGQIIGNINDYTRDQHDLALTYQEKFVKEYLPRISILPLEAFITSSGMAALATIIVMLHRLFGSEQTVLIGKHSYFQNFEIIMKSFKKVLIFDENNESEWKRLINSEQPRAIFVDTLCNEPNLTVTPVIEIAKYLKENSKAKTYLVIDNTMMAINTKWREILKHRCRKLDIVVWESLNKYYQFGLDRVTGGIVWGTGWRGVYLDQARRHVGTIMSDVSTAMLPTPNYKVMRAYLLRVKENREYLQKLLAQRCVGNGAQVVIKFLQKMSYEKIQRVIKNIIQKAKREEVQIVAGTSFGMPNTRVYLTARQSDFTQMFLRISVGTEEQAEFEKIAKIIANCV